MLSQRKAFTMIELVFVIVVVGILASIAIPKFAATRDDAIVTKARATVGAVRAALATERQKRILRGDFNQTITWNSAATAGPFEATNAKILEYRVKKCTSGVGCWERVDATTFKFHGPSGTVCRFDLNNFHFDRNASDCNVPGMSDL
ncbi:type II secretion system protein [Nitratifractor sp.]